MAKNMALKSMKCDNVSVAFRRTVFLTCLTLSGSARHLSLIYYTKLEDSSHLEGSRIIARTTEYAA